MDYDQLIRNWHAKATDEDYFSKFVFEYLAFIALLMKKRFPDSIKDRNAIQRLKQDQAAKELYLHEVENNPVLRLAWQNVKTELDDTRLGNVSQNGEEVEEIKWWNCSTAQLNAQSQADREKAKGVIHDLNDWENMVEFLYSIRNNLFHGGKNPQDTRDRLLVENGYKALGPMVEILLHN